MNTKLTIELVPRAAYGLALRNMLPSLMWNALRRAVYSRDSYVCSICGGVGLTHPVEAHESWLYSRSGCVELVGVRSLCPMCHKVKHWRRSLLVGAVAPTALEKHICAVNKWEQEQLIEYIENYADSWRKLRVIGAFWFDWDTLPPFIEALVPDIDNVMAMAIAVFADSQTKRFWAPKV